MDIRTIRKEKKLSQEQLAKLSGLTSVTISLIETGKVFPNTQTRKKLERALGQRINWMNGKGKVKAKGQTFSELEERLRKVLYDINVLPDKDRKAFLSTVRTYLSEIQNGFTAIQ
jgi:transcriptional regulator with XRE-family HTH domain